MQLSIVEQNIIKDSIKLKPQNRYLVAEKIIESLSIPDEDLNQLWLEESNKRLKDYKKGELETLSYDQVFNRDLCINLPKIHPSSKITII